MSKQSKPRLIDADSLLETFQSWVNLRDWAPELNPGLQRAMSEIRERADHIDTTCNFRNPGWEERAYSMRECAGCSTPIPSHHHFCGSCDPL